jgi:fructosamine-3-kinase
VRRHVNIASAQRSLFCSLAIARIFGGFPPSFFATYHEHSPKTEPVKQYESRVDLYELYHYLNHTVLFGVSLRRVTEMYIHSNQQGAYAGSAMEKMDKLLQACPSEKH